MAWQTYDRSVLPDGRVQGPQGANAGEIIGQQLDRSGAELGSAADDMIRSAQITQARNDAAWAGNVKPQMMLDTDAYVQSISDPTSKAYIDPATGAYSSAISKYISDYGDKVNAQAPSAASKAEMSSYVSGTKLAYLRDANATVAKAQMAQRFQNIDASNQKSGALLVTNPTRFDQIAAQQEQLIRSQLGGDTAAADKEVGKMRSTMAGYAMNGQAQANPQQFLKTLPTWGDKGASPTDMAQAKNIADAEIKRQQAEAKAASERAQAKFQADVGSRLDDAISSVQQNGGVMPLVGGKPLVTNAEIDAAYPNEPIRAQRAKDKLRAATVVGGIHTEINGTTSAQDDAKIAALKPKPGEIVTDDDATVRKAYLDEIAAKRKALDDEVQADLKDSQNEAQNKVAANFADWAQTAQSSGSIPEEAATAIAEGGYSPAQVSGFRDKLQQAVRLGGAEKAINDGRVSEASAMVGGFKSDAEQGGSGSADAAELYNTTIEEVQKKQSAFAGKDPAGAAVTYNKDVSAAWDNWQTAAGGQDTAATAAAFSRAIALTTTEQDRQNVPPSKRQPLPASVATSVAQTIAAMPNPKEQLQALQQYTVPSNQTLTRQVLGQISGVPGALPQGIDLVIDAADPATGNDPARAERMLAGLNADTKGISLDKDGNAAMTTLMQTGLVGALATQANITGDAGTATNLAAPVRAAVEKLALAKISLGAPQAQAVQDAYTDFTAQYATLNDPSIAALYYPKAVEDAAPGALEAGLLALRQDAGGILGPTETFDGGNRYVNSTARDIAKHAVWINSGGGFALIVPGTSRALAFTDVATAQARGAKELKSNSQYTAPVLPSAGPANFVPLQ